MKLAILAFLYCEEFVRNPTVVFVCLIWLDQRFYIVGSGEFCLIWTRTMSLRFREGNKVALMRGTEGDSESVLLAEYTKTDLYNAADERVRVHSHLRFIRHEILRERFSQCNHEKWLHNPILNFSVQAKVDQIASVNVPTTI